MGSRVLLLASLGLLVALPVPFVTADDPTDTVQQAQACGQNREQEVVKVLPGLFNPGQVGPAVGGTTVIVDACIRNNGRLIFQSQDSTATHRIMTSNDNGACFDFLRDRGHLMANNEQYNLMFHWHDTQLILVSQDGRPQRDCSQAATSNTNVRSLIPFTCLTHADTMNGQLILRSI